MTRVRLPHFEPPTGVPWTKPFWDATKRGELSLPVCSVCRRWQWYPDDAGVDCAGGELVWVPVATAGSLHTFTRVQRAFLPDGRDDVPFVVGFIELDGVDGPRLVGNVVDDGRVRIGARVRARFEPVGDHVHPLFEVVDEAVA